MHVLRIAARRQMHAHARCAPNRDHRIGNFKHEPGAVFNRSTVFVGTMISSVLQELIEQVAIGPVYLRSVKACQFGVLGSFSEGFNNARNFGCLKCTRRHIFSSGAH